MTSKYAIHVLIYVALVLFMTAICMWAQEHFDLTVYLLAGMYVATLADKAAEHLTKDMLP